MSELQYFTLTKTADDIVWLTIQIKDSERHQVHAAFLYEFLEVIESIKEKKVKGLVIRSALPDIFLTGIQTDTLSLLANEDSSQKPMGFFSLGNQLCRYIERLECPTIALVEGECTGAGIEIITSCDYRLAVDTPVTQLSYPSLHNGYMIGFGGMTKLVRLLDFDTTITFVTSAQPYDVQKSQEVGLVDVLVAPHKAQWLATQWINQPEDNISLPRKSFTGRVVPLTMTIAFASMRKKIQAPSTLALNVLQTMLDIWTVHGASVDAQHEEITAATSLITSKPVRNKLFLQQLLHSVERQYKEEGVGHSHKPKRVHIIGSGRIGKYLAKLCAFQGLQVSIYDGRHAALASVLGEVSDFLQQQYPHHPETVQQGMDNIILDVHNAGVKHADIVIESIPEDKHAKLAVLREVEKSCQQKTCIITTTSCIPLEELSKDMEHPQRLIGLNIFNPIFISTMAELAVSSDASEDAIHQAVTFAFLIQRTPVSVKSVPGFLSTRLLMAYLIEALTIHQSGIPIADIDMAALELGMSHGPFELIDELGLEECLKNAEALADRLGHDVPQILMQKVEQGIKGKYAGEGFYQYKKGKRVVSSIESLRGKWPLKKDTKDIQKRLLAKMINESRECLSLGIVDHADLVDLMIVNAVGFSVEKGGALKYLEQVTRKNKG